MYATEFKTVINEPYIGVSEFEKFKGREVRVIIIDIDKTTNTDKSGDDFIYKTAQNPKSLQDGDAFLSRDEANER